MAGKTQKLERTRRAAWTTSVLPRETSLHEKPEQRSRVIATASSAAAVSSFGWWLGQPTTAAKPCRMGTTCPVCFPSHPKRQTESQPVGWLVGWSAGDNSVGGGGAGRKASERETEKRFRTLEFGLDET